MDLDFDGIDIAERGYDIELTASTTIHILHRGLRYHLHVIFFSVARDLSAAVMSVGTEAFELFAERFGEETPAEVGSSSVPVVCCVVVEF